MPAERRPTGSTRGAGLWGVVAICATSTWGTVGCGNEPGAWAKEATNLALNSRLVGDAGTAHAERITDGVAVAEGAFWRSPETAVLRSEAALIELDLGEARPICCAVLQGDDNDAYHLEVATEPGTDFVPLWTAGPARGGGIRTRHADHLGGYGRLVRIHASGGDGSFALAEVALYETAPSSWPPEPISGRSPLAAAKLWLLLFAAASSAFFIVAHRRARRWIWALALLPAVTGVGAAVWLVEALPLFSNDEAYVRAVLAAIAAALLLREMVTPARWALDRRLVTGSLVVLSLLGAATYYHFGVPQFRDASTRQGVFIHPWDMRNYFPVAKYFDELRYDGLYVASLAAHLDNNPQRNARSIARVRLRDLTNNQMVYAGEIEPEIAAVRQRFTAERWQEFLADMAYFEQVMGTAAYLGSLQDHGGNATPVWVTTAHLLYRWVPASELSLTLTALIDPLLLILLFVVVARTFGLRAALLTLVIFVTTDFSRFGSNLVASTMRYDWIVALGLAACAMERKRWALGGVLLAWAGLIRAFPTVSALFLVVPVCYWAVGWWREHRALPGLATLRQHQRPFFRVVIGGLACVLFWLALPAAIFSWEGSWGAWFDKIAIHAEKPNVNHVGLRTVIGYDGERTAEKVFRRDLPEPWTDWQTTQLETLERRKPLFYLGVLLFAALAVLAARRGSLARTALIGSTLVPILFYPANYYVHYICLWPLVVLAGGRRASGTAAGEGGGAPAGDPEGESYRLTLWVTAAICVSTVATYPTLATPWADVCFTQQSAILLVTIVAILAPLAWLAWDRPGAAKLLAKLRAPAD